MGRTYCQLTMDDRRRIDRMLARKTPIVENKRLSEALAWVKARQDEIKPEPPKTHSEAGGYVPRPKGRRGRISFVDRHVAAKAANRTASAGAAAKHGLSAAPAEAP
jgi:hypothetical protein